MTEIPTWWLVISALFFLFGTLAMIACMVLLSKLTQLVMELKPKVLETAERVEKVSERVEEVATTVNRVVQDLAPRVTTVAHATQGILSRSAPVVTGLLTAIKIIHAARDFLNKRAAHRPTHKSHPAKLPAKTE
jgi:hypothetical protein